jgi:glycosyltransferase involved in cell wall biosynthesis
LILCNDAIGADMAGPGIRYWEFARALAADERLNVRLAVIPSVPAPASFDAPPFLAQVLYCENDDQVRSLAATSDVIITQGALLAPYPFLAELRVPLVLDSYIPFLLERLSVDTNTAHGEHLFAHESYRRVLGLQIRAADLILCASEKQRDYWLGAMSALGRINPYTHADDPTLRRLIAVVPFGLPADLPCHTRQVLKGVHPSIAVDDQVLLWGGGIWRWFDATTLIRSMARLAGPRPNVKLFFMGVQRPNPQSGKIQAAAEAIALSQELGLYNRTVFFNDWVPYAERQNYLLEADIGVSLHRDHLETRFAFRTRFLDNLWAGLPIVATRGDVLSELIEAQGLGRLAEPGDVEGVTEAILNLLDTPNLRESFRLRFERIAEVYRWETVTRPLIEFCAAPRLAPDRTYLRGSPLPELSPTPWWGLPDKAWRALQMGGIRGLTRQIDEYRRWLKMRRGAA